MNCATFLHGAWRATPEAGRRIGSHGYLCIHPAQVSLANDIFNPTGHELKWARRVVAAWNCPQGNGALAIDAAMVDLPVVERARDMLARHRA